MTRPQIGDNTSVGPSMYQTVIEAAEVQRLGLGLHAYLGSEDSEGNVKIKKIKRKYMKDDQM